jgi:dihydrofolate synthase/folylpolyglutamate synthase
MVQHMLSAAGYRCGLYTSPHIHHLTERFVIDGQPARAADLRAVVEQLQPAIAEVDRQAEEDPEFGKLTFFDLCTAAAFVHFRNQAVQVAVIEVGMGGRLDSTNVVQPLVTVITNVSLDHTQQLGDTVAAIAGEKGGIIKHQVPIISGVGQADARDVIRSLAAGQQAPLLEAVSHFSWTATDDWQAPCTVRVWDRCSDQWVVSQPLHTPLLGTHQRDNLALAFAVVVQLRALGWELSDHAVQAGLSQAQPRGRFQILSRRPWVVLDVAHNPASFSALVATLRHLEQAAELSPPVAVPSKADPGDLPPRRRTLVFAVSRDKDYREMLQTAGAYFDRIVFTRFHKNPRAVEPSQLAETLAAVTDPLRPVAVDQIDDPQAAFRAVCDSAAATDMVVVAGSLFLLAEIGSWNVCRTVVE